MTGATEHRKARYKYIHVVTKKDLNWKKDDLKNYLFAEYQVESMTELSIEQLEGLYNKIAKIKSMKKPE